MSAAFKEHGNYQVLPSYDDLIKPLRIIAKHNDTKPLTEAQHDLAKRFGFKDWQSLTYWFKCALTNLGTVDLSEGEWGYIYDICNGWLVSIERWDDRSLLVQVIDSDRYECLSGKWLGEQSFADNYTEEFRPSKPMRKFIDKLQSYSKDQTMAITLKGMCFWDRTIGL